MTTPTPRTDASEWTRKLEDKLDQSIQDHKNLQETLRLRERELAEAKAENERLAKLELAVIQTKEIDKLKDELDKLRSALNRVLNYDSNAVNRALATEETKQP